jgi:hypothetical protein
MEKMRKNLWVLQLALVIGTVYLASCGMDGWGWLVFALIITL